MMAGLTENPSMFVVEKLFQCRVRRNLVQITLAFQEPVIGSVKIIHSLEPFMMRTFDEQFDPARLRALGIYQREHAFQHSAGRPLQLNPGIGSAKDVGLSLDEFGAQPLAVIVDGSLLRGAGLGGKRG